MLRSLTVKRVVLVLAVACVFGLAVGAGLSVVGTWMARQNESSAFPFGGASVLAQSGDYLMQCSLIPTTDLLLDPPPECLVLGGGYGCYRQVCVIVNAASGHVKTFGAGWNRAKETWIVWEELEGEIDLP